MESERWQSERTGGSSEFGVGGAKDKAEELGWGLSLPVAGMLSEAGGHRAAESEQGRFYRACIENEARQM